MNKYNLKAAVFLLAALPVLLVGCAIQPQQTQPGQQEVSVEQKVENDHRPLVIESVLGSTKEEPRNLTEELPVIAEESAVFFSLGSATLSYKEKQKLEIIAERLAADRNLHVTLMGYANDNGSSSFNLAVSDNRVTVVAAFLRNQGVQAGQIRVRALGSEKVAPNCRSFKCRQQFRRVDLLIAKSK